MRRLCRKRRHLKLALTITVLLYCLAFSNRVSAVTSYQLHSPDNRIQVIVRVDEQISYDVTVNGKLLLQNSTISLNVDHHALGKNAKVDAVKTDAVDRTVEPVVKQKFAKIQEHYNELRLSLTGNFSLTFRAYNEGVAYRLETSLPQTEIKVYSEEANLNFGDNYAVYYPREESFFSHNEREFVQLPLNQIAANSLASLPAVLVAPDHVKLVVAESDVDDYPGLWLHGNTNNSLTAVFPPYPFQDDFIRNSKLKIHMMGGGGWAARILPQR
ncbi:MAG TPA: glycoside hydrolase family 97 N-terminal domain-containing protein [Pyrinomonadaceae bacterium]|nr:glycoside hydrolase family 97 N-terminal domain-containing protein [Pyrinomonadaceae bacterium]